MESEATSPPEFVVTHILFTNNNVTRNLHYSLLFLEVPAIPFTVARIGK
jgi:hypothetical protein